MLWFMETHLHIPVDRLRILLVKTPLLWTPLLAGLHYTIRQVRLVPLTSTAMSTHLLTLEFGLIYILGLTKCE